MHHIGYFHVLYNQLCDLLIHMQVWDFSSFIASLEDSGTVTHKDNGIIHNHVPLKVFSGHKDEGYAIDWSPNVTGRLVSGVYKIVSPVLLGQRCRHSQNTFVGIWKLTQINLIFVNAGDCNKCIHFWEPTSSNWSVDAEPFVGHSASVEDLQVCHIMMCYIYPIIIL